MEANELRDHLVKYLQDQLTHWSSQLVNEDLEMAKTQVYRGRYKQCREMMDWTKQLKL